MKPSIFVLICLITFGSCQPVDLKIYVSTKGTSGGTGRKNSPVQSIHAAQQLLQDRLPEFSGSEIEIILADGNYYLNEPLTFRSLGQVYAGVTTTIRADNPGMVHISGGILVDQWEKSGELWKAKLPIDEIQQFYVNHQRAMRARWPNEGQRWYLDSVTAIRDSGGDAFEQVALWLNPTQWADHSVGSSGFEVVIFKDWATMRKQVQDFDPATGQTILKPPFALFDGNYNGLLAPYVNRFSCYFEGHYSFIDTPGEWAYDPDTGYLYYKPLPGEDIQESVCIVPQLQRLVQIVGTRTDPVKNLQFKGIHFEHVAYLLPAYGHDGRQACFFYNQGTGLSGSEALIEEAIRIEWAEQIGFSNCKLQHTGANGIYVTTGSNAVSLDQLELSDIGGNSLMIGTAFDPLLDSLSLVRNVRLQQSRIHDGGVHYQSAVGVWLGFCSDVFITENEIYNHPYTGISVGWQWNPQPTSSRNNSIIGNHIYDVMKMLGDGGGIYTLGFQPGSVISGNIIHDIQRSELNHASPNNGLFIDEGSKGYVVRSNTIYRVAHTCIRGHRAAGVELVDNTFVYGELPAISHTPPYGQMIFSNIDSTIVWPNPGWPPDWGYPEHITAFSMEGNSFIPLSEWLK